MALRALVFSSDGSATSALCHILTDLGIEAELCSEMLVAVERITGQAYNALLVDWDQQAEAIFLVKQLRELKLGAQALTLALVENDQDLPQALQAGANSVIRKPIDPRQAHDTLSTAKQLILARQVEPRASEPRIAPSATIEPENAESTVSADAPASEAAPNKEGGFAIDDPNNAQSEEPKTKRGFLQQTAPRSAVEAEQQMAEEEAAAVPPPDTRLAPDPAARERALSILGYGSKPEAKPGLRTPEQEEDRAQDSISAIPSRASHPPQPRDLNQEFSALPEVEEETQPASTSIGSKLVLFAVSVCFVVAVSVWMLGPGRPYVASLKGRLQSQRPTTQAGTPIQNTTLRSVNRAPVQESKSIQMVQPDPDLTESEDAASSNIQIIENKPIPIPGAQQPPTSDAPPDAVPVVQTPPPASSSEPPPAAATTSAAAIPAPIPADAAASASHPQLQSATANQAPSPAPQAASSAPVTLGAGQDSPMNAPAVIIPDSLKKAPPASSINSVEPPIIPEETSRSMLLKQVDPEYPPIAIPQRLEGTVILQALVGQDGTVRDLKLVRGYFLLGRSAFEAVRQWRFKPYAQNGKPSEFQTYVTISFKLPN